MLIRTSWAAAAALTIALSGCAGDADDAPLAGGPSAGELEPNPPLGEPIVNEGVEATATYEVSVPEMHCPYGCYPAVSETLAKLPGVAKVRLADEADAQDGEIEDRRVFVEAGEGFDIDAALSALEEERFPATAEKVDG